MIADSAEGILPQRIDFVDLHGASRSRAPDNNPLGIHELKEGCPTVAFLIGSANHPSSRGCDVDDQLAENARVLVEEFGELSSYNSTGVPGLQN